MSRSPTFLRRGILGVAFTTVLGFGATQALATPAQARAGTCEGIRTLYEPPYGCPECESGFGYCNGYDDYCVCY